MTRYILAAIAGIWMADGLALLIAPLLVIRRLHDSLAENPHMLRWEAIGMVLGLMLLLWSTALPYQPLWWMTGSAMVIKGGFLTWGPAAWRTPVLSWCFAREAIDYRFVGLWLCMLAVLLLHALGLLQG
ncbi:MAG: hypothetical protein R3B11_03685 [Nitrospira sp.]|jgi:hypothetical protein|nr:hypothetical protein [Nitrospira sp.]MCW5787035.1 hypothetical protein [Nitrospira sp.]MDR4471816.1 hypothetical protein [Nitrospira sp.]MDR4475092.1 hypothetical protein [Nitrospira sp.]HAP41529.1 hypothetical protein [Nitrospira sp.]